MMLMPCHAGFNIWQTAVTGEADTHCLHAQPTATGPCETEKLKILDCTLYEMTCKNIIGHEAYSNCANIVAVNDADA